MSWKEVNPMQQKILFIADYLRQVSNMTDLCARRERAPGKGTEGLIFKQFYKS